MVSTQQTSGGACADLFMWLIDHDVPFQTHVHPVSYTALATAFAEGVDPKTFAKVVAVRDSTGRRSLVVVDATDAVDLGKLSRFLGVEWVALLSEREMRDLLPTAEPGTIPPVPYLAHVAVYADNAVRADEAISFHAGTHEVSARVKRAAWERAAGIRYGDLVRDAPVLATAS